VLYTIAAALPMVFNIGPRAITSRGEVQAGHDDVMSVADADGGICSLRNAAGSSDRSFLLLISRRAEEASGGGGGVVGGGGGGGGRGGVSLEDPFRTAGWISHDHT